MINSRFFWRKKNLPSALWLGNFLLSARIGHAFEELEPQEAIDVALSRDGSGVMWQIGLGVQGMSE